MSFSDFITALTPNLLSTIALLFGVAGVWLTIAESIWCWPSALVSVLASLLEFYTQRLYGDMTLQLFYFFAGLYGWVYWKKQRQQAFEVRHTPTGWWLGLVSVTLLQWLVYYFLLLYFNGDRPLLDGLLTACSLTATYMMTKKWVENWLTWVFIDAAYIALYSLKAMWPFAFLYLLFTIMAFAGWLKWKKTVSLK